VSLSVAVVLVPSQPPALTSRRPNKKAALEVRECGSSRQRRCCVAHRWSRRPSSRPV